MKRTRLKRRANVRLSLGDLAARRRFHDDVVAGGCVMCRHFPPTVDLSREIDVRTVEAHHAIPQNKLKREGLHEHLWDRRNGIALCVYHHQRNHNFTERVPRELVRSAEGFAIEHGLLWALDWEYRHERLSR